MTRILTYDTFRENADIVLCYFPSQVRRKTDTFPVQSQMYTKIDAHANRVKQTLFPEESNNNDHHFDFLNVYIVRTIIVEWVSIKI